MQKDLQRLLRDRPPECCGCGSDFGFAVNAYVGYSDTGNLPWLVGDCCVTKLRNVVRKMTHYPRRYEIPQGDTRIWRYLDLGKFLSLFTSRSLFFARADSLIDPYEGASGVIDNQEKFYEDLREKVRQALSKPKLPFRPIEMDEADIEQLTGRTVESRKGRVQLARTTTYISCWHENDDESEALWKLYGSSNGQALAITSTVERLNNVLEDDFTTRIGRVKYIDFGANTLDLGSIDTFFFKRKAFSHEREIRAVMSRWSEPPMSGGISKPVDIDELIDEIYVDPTAPKWLQDTVKVALEKFGYTKSLAESSIALKPFY